MRWKMAEIKIGDKLHCIACGEEFECTNETFVLTPQNEVVICPHCNKAADSFEYLFAQLKQEKPKPVITGCDVELFGGDWVIKVEFTVGGEEKILAARI